jgi:hypothetical protein
VIDIAALLAGGQSDAFSIPPGTRDISAEVLDERGRMRVLPAAFWAATAPAERMLFGYTHGIYSFPTVELVDRLRELIDGRSAIEIGAGHGVLAEALDIPATDSRQQEKEPYRSRIIAEGQPPVRYGDNVSELHAIRAIRRHRPKVVIGCWVTHKYRRDRHWAGGNAAGVVEEEVIANCQAYIFVGNERVHRHKSIWSLPHEIEYPDYVYSRAMNGTRDFIAVWPGSRMKP